MISSIITPFRWYNKYYQQNRWDIECKSVCEFQLITDQHHLLPFQIKRDPSFALITNWILRPCCNDTNAPLLNDAESNFIENWDQAGAWTPNTRCEGGISAITNQGFENSNICYNHLIIGQTYTITVNAIIEPSHSSNPYIGTNFGEEIHESGTYTYTFVASSTSLCFSSQEYNVGDVLILNNIQITQAFSVVSSDIVLNPALLFIKNLGLFDIISYCGSDLSQTIPVGCYYSVMKDELNNLYFSEVITVKNFDPNKSPYFILEWYNSCDFSDVIFSGSNGCTYKNRLYLPDAVLTKPAYPFKEEGEEDGNQNFNATFQKWQKVVSLFGYKLPEFIVDALTAIRLHNNIKYYYPLRQKQLSIDAAVEIKSVDYDVQYVINDCFANVELKMTLNDQFVDETCCKNIEVFCKSCSKTIPGLNIEDEEEYEYALMQPDPLEPPALYQYINNEWTLVGSYVDGVWTSSVSSIGDIICDDDLGELETNGGWQIQDNNLVQCPLITSAVFTTGQNWLFIGNLFNDTYGQIDYSIDGGMTWIPLLPKFNQAQISAGIQINVGITCNCTFLTRMRMFDLNGCLYGTSPNKVTTCQTTSGC